MSVVIGIIIAAALVYTWGKSSGKELGRNEREKELAAETAKTKNELDSIAADLSSRISELAEQEAAINRRDKDSRALHRKENEYRAKAKIALQEAEKNVDEIISAAREKSSVIIRDAEDKFNDAYRNGVGKREDELRLLIHSLLSQRPNNRHFAHVLSDAENILVSRTLDECLSEKAPTTAKNLQQKFAASHRKDREIARFYKYQCELYEEIFPELKEYQDDESEIKTDIIKTDETDWLSEEEYNKLTPAERSQLALDRYIKSPNKSKWRIGRDFELFVGYEYRRDGWKVEQTGIRDGLQDLGRDLICKKGTVTHIVQCKYWSQAKMIHEKHIAQLFGTTAAYNYEHPTIKTNATSDLFKNLKQPTVVPVFITSTSVSEQAKKFAKALNVEIIDNKQLGDFPRIKCNITKDGEKIFHLPFDQQYDRTDVISADGDFYAMTVAEAMEKGFRRAKRHLFEI